MMNPRRSRGRRGVLAIVIALLTVLGLVAVIVSQDEIEELVVDPAPVGTSRPAPPAVRADERAFYDYVAPRLAALTAEAEVLEQMGRDRSRNLVQLEVRSDRVSQLADEIDAFLSVNAVSARLQPTVDRYVVAVAQLRAGMEESRSAFFRFDWDAVATGLDTFGRGADELRSVLATLQELVAGPATPSAAFSWLGDATV